MSDETRRLLEDAIAAASQTRAVADQQKNDCLAQVADGLPSKLDDLAKAVAQAEPEVTKALGKAGIGQLRAELAEEAGVLATDLRGAADRVKWPLPQSEYDKADSTKIHSALFKYMYGVRVNKLAAVFKRHGYSTRDHNRERSQGLIFPQSLYEQEWFGPLAQALNALGDAERTVAKAKRDDDIATVGEIWGDS